MFPFSLLPPELRCMIYLWTLAAGAIKFMCIRRAIYDEARPYITSQASLGFEPKV